MPRCGATPHAGVHPDDILPSEPLQVRREVLHHLLRRPEHVLQADPVPDEGGKDRGDIARQTDRHQLLLRGVELEDLLRKRVQRHHQKRAGIFFIEIRIGVDPWKLSRPVIVDDMSEGAFQIGSISVGIGSCA